MIIPDIGFRFLNDWTAKSIARGKAMAVNAAATAD